MTFPPNTPVRPRPGIARVIAAVAEYYWLDPADLSGPSQQMHVTHPRYVAMYFLRRLGLGYAAIGAYFARRHTTAMYGVGIIGRRLAWDGELWLQIEAIAGRVGLLVADARGELAGAKEVTR